MEVNGDEEQEFRGRIIQFSKEEREFFKNHGYNLQDWIHLAIEKSIVLKDKNIDSLDLMQHEIDKENK